MPRDYDEYDDYDDDDHAGIEEDDREADYYEHMWGGPEDEELEDWYEEQEGAEDEYDYDEGEFGPGDVDPYGPALPAPEPGDEAASRQHFAALKRKYRAESFRGSSPLSPLYKILLKLESKEQMDSADQSWLRKYRLKGPIRIFATRAALDCESRFKETGDPWEAVKASSFWRMAEQPGKSLAISEGLADSLGAGNSKVKAALLTTRGGAFRDQKRLDEAKSLGEQAIKLNGQSFHPFMLLGAVYYQQGDPQNGDKYFANAIKLGAKPENQDWEIRKAVGEAGDDEQRFVAQYLLQSRCENSSSGITKPL